MVVSQGAQASRLLLRQRVPRLSILSRREACAPCYLDCALPSASGLIIAVFEIIRVLLGVRSFKGFDNQANAQNAAFNYRDGKSYWRSFDCCRSGVSHRN